MKLMLKINNTNLIALLEKKRQKEDGNLGLGGFCMLVTVLPTPQTHNEPSPEFASHGNGG